MQRFWSSVDLTGNHTTVPLPRRVHSRTVRPVGLDVRPSPLDVRFGPCGPVARQFPTGVRFGLFGVFRHEKSRPWAAVRYDEIRRKLFDSPIETCSPAYFLSFGATRRASASVLQRFHTSSCTCVSTLRLGCR